jgi:ABC-type sugar transport system permease subunit
LKAIKRTVVFLILNYSTVFLYGIPLALLMYELTAKFKKTFFTVIYLPYIISGLGIGMLLMMLFSPDSGSMNLLLLKLGILDKPIDVKDPNIVVWALPTIVGWRYAGFNMALFLSGLLSIPVDTIEASVVDGASYLKRLRYIYFPQMMSSIVMATIFCLIGSFGVFDELVGMGALMVPDLEYFAILLYHVGLSGGWGSKIGTLSQAITMSFAVYLPLIVLAFGLNRWQKKLQY